MIRSETHDVVASSDFQELVPFDANPADYAPDAWQSQALKLWETCALEVQRAAIAGARKRLGEGLEIVPAHYRSGRSKRNLWLADDPTVPWGRRKSYALAVFTADAFENALSDRVLLLDSFADLMLEAGRLIGTAIGVECDIARTARPEVFRAGITVRPQMATLVHPLHRRSEPNRILVLSHATDSVYIRLGAYYHIAPPGPELEVETEEAY